MSMVVAGKLAPAFDLATDDGGRVCLRELGIRSSPMPTDAWLALLDDVVRPLREGGAP